MAQLVVAAAGAAIGGATLGTGVVALGMTGTSIGWMVGSLVGSMLFAEKAKRPEIGDGSFTSNIYGQAIPVSYGTIAHAGQVAWWSGLIVRTEEVGGKGGGGAEVQKARMNLLLAVCEGPQAAVLRIWANGRLIATFNGVGFDLDAEVLPAGEVRVYLGTETQTADPTYEAAVGSENAVTYRGTVMVAIDGLEGELFANRPPTFKIEVASGVEFAACPLDPIVSIEVQQAGLFTGTSDPGANKRNAAAFDAANGLYYVVTDGADKTSRQIEAYDVNGAAPTLYGLTGLTAWQSGSGLNVEIGGLGFDPENSLVRIAGGWAPPFPTFPSIPIEYIYNGTTLYASGAKFADSGAGIWGDYPAAGEYGGTGAFYGVVYSIYPDSGSGHLGEAGWWTPSTAIINYRLAQLVNADGTYAWHSSANDGRRNEIGDVLYVPKDASVFDGGGFNIAWRYSSWHGYLDVESSVSSITGATGDDATDRGVSLAYAPGRKRVYVVTYTDGIASIDVDAVTGNAATLDATLSAYPTEIDYDVNFSVWNSRGDGLVLGGFLDVGGTYYLKMALIDPDTMDLIVGPCEYQVEKYGISAPVDLGDGRFACIYGSDSIAMIAMPGGVAAGQPVTLQTIVEDVCERSGLPSANLDASAGADVLVGGFKLASQTTGRQAIESLVPGYFFDLVESGTELVLRKRGAASVATIDAGELGAAVFQLTKADPEPPYELEHIEEEEVPRVLELTWIDPEANYDPGTQKAERSVGTAKAIGQIQVPVVFNGRAQEAARAANVNLWHAHASKNPISLKLSHAYDHLEGADAIEVPLSAGVTQRVRIERLTRARPLLEIEGVFEEASIYTQGMGGVPRYQGPRQSGIGVVGATRLALLDVPPLRDQDDELVIYSAMARSVYDAAWPGASLYRSADGGSSYASLYSTATGATIGAASGALGSWAGGNVWDDTNTVDVVLSSGTFSSATDLAVLNGANAVAIQSGTDWEIVQFTTATLVGENTWHLSRLLRGRKGTERAVAGHAPGDRVVLLSEASLRRIDLSLGEIGAARHYKGVTSGQAVASAAAVALTLAGRSLMPLSPVRITGERDLSDDLTITWIRRARVSADWNDYVDVPLDEQSESYQVDIIDGSSVVRTLTASTPSVVYTAAQQTSDFGSPQSSVEVAIYQISSRVGRGHAGEAIV